MLDPIKVSIVTPGINDNGSLAETGLPATLVTAYLDEKGIVVEKTTDFTILFLFSLGVTKGKYGTLIAALLRFKQEYDANTPVAHVLPDIYALAPERYSIGLRDLANQMFQQMKHSNQLLHQQQAFSELPRPVFTPCDAYSHLVHGDIELVPLNKIANRIVATGIVPYPPGIPMLMPGECIGSQDGPYINYLEALQEWDRKFVGFTHETHGVEVIRPTSSSAWLQINEVVSVSCSI
jgi:arginine decarboxylase